MPGWLGCQNTEFLLAGRLCSRLTTIEIAASASVAVMMALIPRTIIVHFPWHTLMVSPCT
jgi:hypothetical protein